MNGLLAAKRLGVEATIVVMNNGGGGIFDFLPIAEHRDGYEELFATPTGLDLAAGRAPLRTAVHARRELRRPARGARASRGWSRSRSIAPRNVELHRELFATWPTRSAARGRPQRVAD